MARLQLDRHDCPPRSIFDDGHQRLVRRGRPPPTLSRPPHRSLGTLQEFAASLAARSDADLLRLFALRPDAITPPVATFADLASRLSTAASICLALDALNLPQLRVLAELPVGGLLSEDSPELSQLHELALLLRADPAARPALVPAHLPALTHDAGTHLIQPLTAVTLALGSEDSLLGSTLPDFPEAPQPRLAPVSPSMRDNAVGSAVETLLRTMNELLEVAGESRATDGDGDAGASAAGHSRLSVLRDGTLGVRTLRELSKALGLDAQTVNFYLELAAAADLLSFDGSGRCWRADTLHGTAAQWSSLERAEQWFVLVQSWLDNARPPSALLKALEPYDPPRHARLWRRQLVSVMASLRLGSAADSGAAGSGVAGSGAAGSGAAGSAAPDEYQLLAALSWQHPRQTAALRYQIPDLLHELEWLGITGAGAVSCPGRAAVRHDAALAADAAPTEAALAIAAMRALLPAPVDHFVLQGDLTAIAPGFLIPGITSKLKLMTLPEGRGAAGIFRFSQQSLESAAACGLSRTAVLDFLQQHSSTAVPQSLAFLIAEVFRSNPDASSATPSAPSAPPFRVAARRQVAQQTQPGNGVVHEVIHEDPEALALAQLERLRSQPVWANDGVGESGPALVMEELRRALGLGDLLRVRVVDGAGEIEELLLRPVSLVAGTLRARLSGANRERRLSIHRIISAAPARQDAEPQLKEPQIAEPDHANTPATSTSTTSKERHG